MRTCQLSYRSPKSSQRTFFSEVHKSFLLIVCTKQIFTAHYERVLLDTQIFQHLAKLLIQIALYSPPFLYSPVFYYLVGWALLSRIAPHQNYLPRTVPRWIPTGLDTAKFKSGISLATPHQPKPMLQSLPPMLRMNPAVPIRSYSKAPGVFSSNYRYPASSPELHFHRASPRDSFPLITPFVHVGTYPTRNYALRFLLTREGPYLIPMR